MRVLTRGDMDGMTSTVLLSLVEKVTEITFTHPKDMQDGKVKIGADDITANLPYVAAAHLSFDHHLSETIRNSGERLNHVIDPQAPSTARVIYENFGGRKLFPADWDELMAAVDKADSAQFSREEILHPAGWVLLNYLMDARTGLGRFHDFRISNYRLMMDLVDYCKDHSIEHLLQLPDVKVRADMYFDHEDRFKEQILRCAKVFGNLVVLDLRHEEIIYAGNRFMIYALFPENNISIHVLWGVQRQNTVLAVGKSIINRNSNTNIGELMLQYVGGGHVNAGTCQVANYMADAVLGELKVKINADG